MNVISIDSHSSYLTEVKRLWRANKSTLGFFPDAAFAEYAARKQILVALDPDRNCIGYLLYRVSYMKATIVHLCVTSAHRGQGVARLLIDYLKHATKELHGIGLHCRRDYEANKLWPRADFIALDEKVGRSRDGEFLTFWWFDHRHPSLFKFADQEIVRSKIKAAIDSNVFFDLQDYSRRGSKESNALMADWLQGEIAICLTDEILNEINLNPDQLERKKERSFAQKFPSLPSPSSEEVNNNFEALKPLFPKKTHRSDESDIRHLARAIAGGAQFFVTRDTALLRMADEIENSFGLSIVRPSELIVHIDELVRKTAYQPVRVAGSLIQVNRVQSQQNSDLIAQFAQNEKKNDFEQRLYGFLSEPQRFEVNVVRDTDQRLLALVVYDKATTHRLDVPMFRVANSYLARSLTSHLILQTVMVSSNERRTITKISDPLLSESVEQSLPISSFAHVAEAWIKLNLSAAVTASELIEKLASITTDSAEEQAYLREVIQTTAHALQAKQMQTLLDAERILWPAKIVDLDIPTFIVPIKPEWAMHLFDERMAKQTLFGAKPEIALNRENVYYRAAKPRVLSAPARILWYVSSHRKYKGAMHIRACSQLDEVAVEYPSDLFKRFRRLGIYEWKDILGIAKGDIGNRIMAVRFSDTELFSTPVPWNDLQRILSCVEGHQSQIQSPVHISSESFAQIYRFGTQV